MFHDLKVFFHCIFCNQFAKCQRKFDADSEIALYDISEEEDFEILQFLECVHPIE